ncbi:MAG: FAD binding domain-containing protein, partial [Planctomycetota bacterium]
MLRLPPFELRAPRTLEEACEILSVDPQGSRVVAGGTDLYPNMKRRHQQARVVVSLRRAGGLRGIRGGTGGEISIGAMTPLAEIAADGAIRETHPALARAIRSISTPVLRRMGTIGGNLCLDTRCTYYNQSEEWRRSIDYCMKEAGETCWVAPSSPRC